MLRSLVKVCGLVVSIACAAQAQAQPAQPGQQNQKAPAEVWTLLDQHPKEVLNAEGWVRPMEGTGQPLAINLDALRERLAQAPLEGSHDYRRRAITLELPTPDGGFKLFEVAESPVMEAPLQANYPQIRTYVGQGITRRAETLRMSVTPAGLAVQVLGPDGSWYIDPVSRGDTTHYTSYAKFDLGQPPAFRCLTTGVGFGRPDDDELPEQGPVFIGPTLRTYQLAVTATGEYTAFHGGTVASGLAAVVTSVNRVTGIYEREIGVRFVLVSNNDLVIYTSAASDPYTSPGPNDATMTAAQGRFDTLIGNANYDVGHLYHRASNSGVAGAIGNVCVTGGKGRGVSQTEPPVGDPFSVDYVAHELGHQFGGRHSFNNCGGGPGDAASIGHEPASGSTIMGYAGICGSNNLQPNSDAMFASINFDQMTAYVAGSANSCATQSASSNGEPAVNAGPDFTIPARTPFELKPVSFSDPDGDALTFSWEQRNGGTAVALPLTDQSTNPLFRVYAPTTNPVRTLPRLSNLLNNTVPSGEVLPTTSRTMAWRLTVRDNRAGGGGVNFDNINVTTVATAGPFTVTSPASATSWVGGSTQTVTWTVANTTAAPINAANVRILFSTDGGNTWPTVILASTPNDGSQQIIVPLVNTTQGRVRVEGVNNIFFNINQGGLITVTTPPAGIEVVSAGPASFQDNVGNGNSNDRIDSGESAIRVFVPVRNQGLTTATSVSGTLLSLTPTVSVTTSVAGYADVVSFGAPISNTTPFVLNVSPSHPCGNPINLQLNLTTAQGTPTPITFSLATGTPSGLGPAQRFQYTGPAVTIPDNNPTGASASINVAGLTTPVGEVDFSFDGTTCSNTAGATTVGLTHSFVGDTVITLASPAGTVVTLSNRRGAGGNNMCNTFFDDAAATPISSIVASGAPWSNAYRPEGLLSSFNGQSGNGNWTLRVVDQDPNDTGAIRRFSVYIRTPLTPTCQPPLPGGCDGIDFNNDGGLFDPTDIDAFLSVFAEGPCIPTTATCNDIDFNNDGGLFDPCDIDSFLLVFAEGPCTPCGL